MSSAADDALAYHAARRGKIAVTPKVRLDNARDLALAYTPGVAVPSLAIAANRSLVNSYTSRGNMVAVVSDGSAVLGLGDLGPEAALPVMEGKAVLFKVLADIDAFPICLASKDPAVIRAVVRSLTPTFAGINLEDIAAPKCFALEADLQADCDIPIFHDDQHGTAVVVLAAAENAARYKGTDITGLRVVISGAGAAGNACAHILIDRGVRDVTVVDSQGIIHTSRTDLATHKQRLAAISNPRGLRGGIADALVGADVLIGVSVGGVVTPAMITSMRPRPVVFALANPDPEIAPDVARAAGAGIVATGRSDLPNQINNMLGFPGIFRGALDVEASRITPAMLRAAASALARCVPAAHVRRGLVVPAALDRSVAPAVALAVARQAMLDGVARRARPLHELRRDLRRLLTPPPGLDL